MTLLGYLMGVLTGLIIGLNLPRRERVRLEVELVDGDRRSRVDKEAS